MKILVLALIFSISIFANKSALVTFEYDVEDVVAQSDILFVVDNSGSMHDFHSRLVEKANIFINTLGEASFQIMGISSDIGEEIPTTIIRPSEQAESEFVNLIKSFGTNGSPEERLFTRAASYLDEEASNLREGTPLEIILVTDERNQDSLSIETLLAKFGERKVIVNSFIPLSDKCNIGYVDTNDGAFIEIANKTGGNILDLCNEEVAFEKELFDFSLKLVERSKQGQIRSLPIEKHYIQGEVNVNSIKVYYGKQVIKRGYLKKGWFFDEDENSIVFSPEIKLVEQGSNTKFTIQYELI